MAGGCTGSAPECPDDMVGIGEAWFYMGTDKDIEGLESAKPLEETHVDAFCIDKREVTVAEYKACVDAGACSTLQIDPVELKGGCNALDEEHAQHPVNCIDINQARTFCKWQDKRLPTQAEWELAARGMDGRRFPWGNRRPTPKHGNFSGRERWSAPQPVMYEQKDPWLDTAPVDAAHRDRSPFGVEGMAGNVSEWVDSQAAPSKGGRYKGGSHAHAGLEHVDARQVTVLLRDQAPYIGVRCVDS